MVPTFILVKPGIQTWRTCGRPGRPDWSARAKAQPEWYEWNGQNEDPRMAPEAALGPV